MRCSQHYVLQRMYPNSFGMKIAAILGGVFDSLYSSYDNNGQHTDNVLRRRYHAGSRNVSSHDPSHVRRTDKNYYNVV